jgi:hypothetical protein
VIAAVLPLICIFNLSTVPTPLFAQWVRAIQYQVHSHLAPNWGGLDATVLACDPRVPMQPGTWVVYLRPPQRGHDEQQGYHHLWKHGIPVGEVYTRRGWETSVTLSHEVLEMITNPHVDRYMEDGFTHYQLEVADPVQADRFGYDIDGVLVSDFVLPAWFDGIDDHAQPYDYAGHVSHPRQVLDRGTMLALSIEDGQVLWKKCLGAALECR